MAVWLTAKQAVQHSGRTYRQVLAALRSGALPGAQPTGRGSRWLIHRSQVERWASHD